MTSPDTTGPAQPLVLLTGATGYVGGKLLRALQSRGVSVRCMARNPERLADQALASTEVVAGDVLDEETLHAAMGGVDTAFYLIHSMGSSGSFEEADRTAATNFGHAAKAAGIRRIIYLGGLGDDAANLSPHLRSRQEVGQVLRASGVPVLEFRASIVIGIGSLSFEMIRSLVERLPVMITPKWVSVIAQPIYIDDLLEYLIQALHLPETGSRVFEIGGADQVSYAEIMAVYARQRGLRRWMIRVPVLTPRLSSLWLKLVTPLYARVGRKLIASIEHPTIVHDDSARGVFDVTPIGIEASVRRALASEELEFWATHWRGAPSGKRELPSWGGVNFGSRLVDSRIATVEAPPAIAFDVIERIGGDTGWYAWNSLWRLRGLMDLMVGGLGMRRSHVSPRPLKPGDALDCWRVQVAEPNRRLRLVGEMKMPGRAWLEFEVSGDGPTSTIRQTAIFDPLGLLGRAYWYAVLPFHELIFSGMLRGIVQAATAAAARAR